MSRHAQESDDIDVLLDWLEAQKFLSESRFAESLVNRRASRFGSSRILSELQSHGLDESTVASHKSALLDDENERAWNVWEKKFDVPAESPQERAKQMRFLQQRGFSHSAIHYVIKRSHRRDTE